MASAAGGFGESQPTLTLPVCKTCKQQARSPDSYRSDGGVLFWPKKAFCKDRQQILIWILTAARSQEGATTNKATSVDAAPHLGFCWNQAAVLR